MAKLGAAMRDSDEETRKEAARLLGMAKTPKKEETSAANLARVNEERKQKGWSAETRALLSQRQQERRERERLQKMQEAQPVSVQLALPETTGSSAKRRGRPVGSKNKPKEWANFR